MSITLFNPFSLKKATDYSNVRGQIQEVIHYAESRFWTILNETSGAEIDRKIWTQTLLHRELVRGAIYTFGFQ
jgi:hypothetical protein